MVLGKKIIFCYSMLVSDEEKKYMVQSYSKVFQSYSKLFKIIQTGSKLFKIVQNGSKLLERLCRRQIAFT